MKASINAVGCLTIEPESGLEAYALSCWVKENYVNWPSCPVTGESGVLKGSKFLLSALDASSDIHGAEATASSGDSHEA